MATIIDKVIRTFIRSEYPSEVQMLFRGWISDPKHKAEKEAALRNAWRDASVAGNPASMSKSIRTMSTRIGVTPDKLRRKLIFWRSIAAVAVLCCMAGAACLYMKPAEQIDIIEAYVPTGNVRNIVLPDGTQVLLNSRSTLIYPNEFSGKTRSVYLSGEADFKVKSDERHPFVVKTNDIYITALGTEFNVSAYPECNEVAATLISGRVKIDTKNLEPIFLKPCEQYVFNRINGGRTLLRPVMDDVTAWQRGDIVFRNMNLDDIFICLQRKYPYKIVYSPYALSKGKYSFRFKKDASLDEVMRIISKVTGNLSYEIKGDRCSVTVRDER